MPTVLIADDERNIRATIARALRLEGYAIALCVFGRASAGMVKDRKAAGHGLQNHVGAGLSFGRKEQRIAEIMTEIKRVLAEPLG